MGVIYSENSYEARHWNREKATRYIFAFERAVVEASFFSHYKGSQFIKNVIELPTSFGCPVGCKHCASALLVPSKQISISQLAGMINFILKDKSLGLVDRFLITFSGIGEGSFRWKNLELICMAIHASFKRAYFTLTTVGFDMDFLRFVDKLALRIPIHYLQISYLHYDTEQLRKVIPQAHELGFDFQQLLKTVSQLRNVRIRLNFVVIKELNSDFGHVSVFLNRLEGLQSQVTVRISNLNETEASRYYGLEGVPIETLHEIQKMFLERQFEAYVFTTAKNDNMNCGQLAWNYEIQRASVGTLENRRNNKLSQGSICTP